MTADAVGSVTGGQLEGRVQANGSTADAPLVSVRAMKVQPEELDDEADRLRGFGAGLDDVRMRAAALAAGFECAARSDVAARLYAVCRLLTDASDAALRDRVALGIAVADYANAERSAQAAATSAEHSLTGVFVRGIRELLDLVELGDAERALAVSDGAVSVRQADGWQQGAPRDFAALAARIPDTGDGRAQLRVEAYPQPDGSTHYLAYVGGTDPHGGSEEPWNLRADLAADRGFGVSAPERAALAALHDAGARPGDQVLLVGYSLGGMVADSIARHGGFRVPLLVTFGSPIAAKPAAGETLEIAFEHADDPIPATEGVVLPRVSTEPGRTVVRRSVFGGELHAPLDAHALAQYRLTAAGADRARDAGLEAEASVIAAFAGAGLGHVTTWRADRMPSPRPAPRIPASRPGPSPVPTVLSSRPTASTRPEPDG